MRTVMTTQQQYIANWHDSFLNYINGMLTFVESLLLLPNTNDEDKRVIDMVKVLLKGQDAQEIKRSLSEGIVKKETLDKIEKLNKDLTDMVVDHINTCQQAKEILKKLSYYQIEQNKQAELMRLEALQIPVL